MKGLNMVPSTKANAKNSAWFNKPWLFEVHDPKHFAYLQTTGPIHSEDGDMKVSHEYLQVAERCAQVAEDARVALMSHEELEDELIGD
jgi:hypothetical protein